MKNPRKYGKAEGLAFLRKYLPEICPFEKDFYMVSSIEEWNAVKDKFGNFVYNRVDYPIGESHKNAVKGTDDSPDSIPELIKIVNKQSPNGVVLLMNPKEKGVRRYENDGAFNIIFKLGEKITIELVGKGFDGHELTQGFAVHEYYEIPWDEFIFIIKRHDLIKRRMLSKFVKPEMYKKQREERIRFLKKNCPSYKDEDINKNIPEEYKPIDDKTFEGLLSDVVFEMVKQENELRRDNLKEFGVQGNIVRGRPQPWEIFRSERWLGNIERKESDVER